MGYTTEFEGAVKFNKPLTMAQGSFLRKFANTRRMKRDESKAAKMPDPIREAVGLPIGVEAGYFVGGSGHCGQDRDASVLDGNAPPQGQPGLWCKWGIDATGQYLGWNGAEKFYDYVEWLEYLIKHFLAPWGIIANGLIRWGGEERNDVGAIEVTNNVVRVIKDNLAGTHGDVEIE